jgi:hypothetical protein
VPIPASLVASYPAAATAIIASQVFQRVNNTAITDAERNALCVEIYGQLTDAESPNTIDLNDATSISTLLNITVGGAPVTPFNVTEVMLLINTIKGLLIDGVYSASDNTAIVSLVNAFAGETINLDDLLPPPPPPPAPPVADAVRVAGYKYKTGRDGNLTLLFPTQEAMANYLGVDADDVKNYTLTGTRRS